MSIESKGFSELPSQETSDEKERAIAEKELSELNIETSRENLEALIEQQKTQQHPAGYENYLTVWINPMS